MQASLYVAMSGQLALERRLATIANNVANAGTPGYRGEGVHFESLVARNSRHPTAFASQGSAFVSQQSGALTKTGNALDVAIAGDGYLAIQTPAGTAYTRDGRMQLLESGELVTLSGHPVLDAGGAPIVLDPGAGAVDISRDGMLTQRGKQAAAIGLFSIDLTAPFQRYENSGLIPRTPGSPILSFQADGMVQGFVEEANVNPVAEMTRLISVTRAFEGVSTAIEDSNSSLKEAIQTLAARA